MQFDIVIPTLLESVNEQIRDYCLYDHLKSTIDFWNLKPRGLFHETVSLIISQKIRLSLSRKIRADLYKILGTNILTFDNIRLVPYERLISIGFTEKLIETIYCVPRAIDDSLLTIDYFELYLMELLKIKGVGPWTINGIKVMYNYKNTYLCNDKYINKNVSLLFEKDLDEIDIEEIWEDCFHENKRNMCMFFWRIKTTSLVKIRYGHQLTRDDFI